MMRSSSFIQATTVLACAATLVGCQTFSPDSGMSLPVEIAGYHLNKEVTAIRTEDDAYAARSRVEQLLKRPLTADSGRADRPAQQPWPAGGL